MTPDQLFERTIPEPNSGCWLWAGYCDREGYGRHRSRGAHRISYEIHCHPIPEGGNILHSCDQPSCVNPDHLRVGTLLENAEDRAKRGRTAGAKGIAHGFAKLTDDEVRAIRTDARSTRRVGREYDIDPSQVSRIRRKLAWGHVI